MNTLLRTSAMISTAALLTFGMAGFGNAAQVQVNDKTGNNCVYGQDANCPAPGQGEAPGYTKKHLKSDQGADQGMGNNMQTQAQAQTNTRWKFDPNREERRHHKDAKFRFLFNGFWYPSPYWTMEYGYGAPNGISCGAGRAAVSSQGFYHVRVVECQGRTYTYLGSRHGRTFQIIVSSRSGRVVGIARI